MVVKIHNVGIILDSRIRCDGITLITGKNGSGKTTFGKAFVSLFSGINNAPKTYADGFIKYARETIAETLGLRRNSAGHYYFGSYPRIKLRSLYYLLNSNKYDIESYLSLLNTALEELTNDKNAFEELLLNNMKVDKSSILTDDDFAFIIRRFETTINDIKNSLESSTFLDAYVSQSVKDQFDNSFFGQVKNIDNKKDKTYIEIENDGVEVRFDYDDARFNHLEPLENIRAFYIDDSGLIDKLYDYTPLNRRNLLDYFLIQELKKPINRVNRLRVQDELRDIFEIINHVYPYDFLEERKTLSTNNFGIKIKNEAYGRKVFAIVKEMLYRNLITKESILVFDEPDNHLHPEWQIEFIKLITKINQRIGAKIVCITHSSTLLLASQVYCKKNIPLNVYYCDSDNNRPFMDVSNDIQRAHKELADPYILLDLFGDKN